MVSVSCFKKDVSTNNVFAYLCVKAYGFMKIEDEIKSKFRNEKHKVIVNLHFTQLAVTQRLNEVLKEFNVSLQQYNVLRILRGQHPNAASIGLIKERMLDKNSDVSRIIDRLNEKKVVIRKECKLDRRQKDVSISSKGMELLKAMDSGVESVEDAIGAISEADAKKLNETLDEIRKNLRQ